MKQYTEIYMNYIENKMIELQNDVLSEKHEINKMTSEMCNDWDTTQSHTKSYCMNHDWNQEYFSVK